MNPAKKMTFSLKTPVGRNGGARATLQSQELLQCPPKDCVALHINGSSTLLQATPQIPQQNSSFSFSYGNQVTRSRLNFYSRGKACETHSC